MMIWKRDNFMLLYQTYLLLEVRIECESGIAVAVPITSSGKMLYTSCTHSVPAGLLLVFQDIVLHIISKCRSRTLCYN